MKHTVGIVVLLGMIGFLTGCRTIDAPTAGHRLIKFGGLVLKIQRDGQVQPVFRDVFPVSAVLGAGSTAPLPAPSGDMVAVIREGDLWLLDTADSTYRRVTDIARAGDGLHTHVYVLITAWRPDTKQLLYQVIAGETVDPESIVPDLEMPAAPYGYHVYDLVSGRTEPVAIPGSFLAWLESGEFLIEDGSYEVGFSLWRMEPGSSRDLITRFSRPLFQVDVNDAGAELVASFHANADSSQVVAIDLSSGSIRPLTPSGPWAFYESPAWSPEGNVVAYVVGHPGAWKIVVNERRVYSCTSARVRCQFEWLEEDRLVIRDGEGAEMELVVVDVEQGVVVGHHAVSP